MSQEYEKETFYYFKYSNKELGIVNNIYGLIVWTIIDCKNICSANLPI